LALKILANFSMHTQHTLGHGRARFKFGYCFNGNKKDIIFRQHFEQKKFHLQFCIQFGHTSIHLKKKINSYFHQLILNLMMRQFLLNNYIYYILHLFFHIRVTWRRRSCRSCRTTWWTGRRKTDCRRCRSEL